MMQIFLSNKAEILGEKLSMELENPVSDAFTPEIILIQARGMERWLSMIIANKTGICANYDFCFPKKLIHKIIHEEKGLDPELSPYDSETLRFMIFKILEELESPDSQLGPEFDIVRNYCSSDRYGLKRFQLAGHTASLFEKYMLCRPDMISAWDEMPDQSWQAVLWKKITSETNSPHPVTLMRDFTERAKKGLLNTEKIPKRISIFGISNLPPSYISLLETLSAFSEIKLYCLNPCMEYWGNLPKISQRKAAVRKGEDLSEMHFEETNDLLESLGESLSDFLEILYSHETIEEQELFESGLNENNDSLLSFIQNSLLLLENPSSEDGSKHLRKKDDESIGINSCHSPMRETEVLFDRILDLLQKDKTLEPDDIIVMMPDMDTYAPCIEAVFGSAGGSGIRLPYSLADRIPGTEKKAADSFLSILRLRGSRLSRSEILDMLESRTIAARFDLTEEDQILIRKWLTGTRVSGEMDEKQRKNMGLPEFRENTWAHAIDRLLMGIAMDNPEEDSFQGISPFPGIMTANYGTLSKFLEFWSSLSEAINNFECKREITEWVLLISGMLDIFLDDEESGSAKRNIRTQLFRLKDLSDFAGLSQKIDVNIVTEYLSKELESRASAYGFLTGGITFCSMLPMRSIPFRVICLLGMNNDAFPRNDAQLGFDLTREKPRQGDPSIRKDDRQLFLDILISAREKLYISYTGQSARDNAIIPPSVLVSELIDYIEGSSLSETTDTPPDGIITRHPMHGFSPSCFEIESDSRIFSYNREYFDAASAIISEKKDKKSFWENELKAEYKEVLSVSLSDLKKFWKNPCEYAVKKVLGANIDPPDMIADIEGAAMQSGLERYGVFEKNLRLRNLIQNREDRQKKLYSQGLLPHGDLGEIAHGIYEAEADALEGIVTLDHCTKKTIEIDINIEKYSIHGVVNAYLRNDESSQKLIFLRYSSINPAHIILSTWIDFLACRAIGYEAESFMLAGFSDSKKERGVSSIVSGQVSQEEAQKHLLTLIEFYSKGLLKPLLFLPEISMEFAKGVIKNRDEKSLYRDIEEKISGYNSFIKQGFYEELCLGQSIADLFFNSIDFRSMSTTVFDPVIKTMEL